MAPDRAFVLQPGEGRSIDLGNFAMTVKASHDESGGAFSLLEAEDPAAVDAIGRRHGVEVLGPVPEGYI